jgi:hypothetical protein
MDREYLEDYEQREKEELDKFLLQKIKDGTFSLEKDRFPNKERFFKLKEPVAVSSTLLMKKNNVF